MQEIIISLFEVIATFVETLLCFKFVGLIFDSKKETYKIWLYVVFITFFIYQLNHIKIFSNDTLTLVILFVTVILAKSHKENIFHVFCIVFLFYTLVVLIDIFGLLVLSIVYQNKNYGIFIVSGFSSGRIVYIITMKMILSIIYYVINKYKQNIKIVMIQYRKYILVATIVCYCGYLYFKKVAFSEIDNIFKTSWFLFLISIVFMCCSICIAIQYSKEKAYRELMDQSNKMLVEKINYEKQRVRHNHDIKNHFNLVKEMIKDKQYDNAYRYIEGLDEINNKKFVCYTGHEILDLILSMKGEEAKNNNVRYDVQCGMIKLDISEKDITSLFSNLIDNAIEASKRLKEDERWIEVNISPINDMILVEVKNSLDVYPLKKNGRMLSSKRNNETYGLGVSIIKNIVAKYDGEVSYDFQCKTCVVNVMLSNVN